MHRIMLVDDELPVLNALRRTLGRHLPADDYRIDPFESPRQALDALNDHAYTLIISDYRMPDINGVEFLAQARLIQPDAVRLILSAATDRDAMIHAINDAEILRFLAKPWEESELLEAIHLAVQRHDTLIEERHLAEEARLRQGQITQEEVERRRLEEQEPGITRVHWGPDGSVILDENE